MSNLDWNQLRAFHATAGAGSLSAAARQLGLTQPTLSRQIRALEAALGLPLFDRVGKRLVLTQTGAELLAHLRAMGDAADSVALAASGRDRALRGPVRVATTDAYAALILPPIIARIRQAAPQVTLTVLASDSLSNLHRGEADIAIRHVLPDRAGLVGRHVRDTQAHFYASASWVARHGHPRDTADLVRGGLIGFDDAEQTARYLRSIGFPISAGDFRLVSNSALAIWEMLRHGLGAAPMMREIADRTDDVVRLLPDLPPIPVPVWLVTHEQKQASPRIRLVLDILAEELARV